MVIYLISRTNLDAIGVIIGRLLTGRPKIKERGGEEMEALKEFLHSFDWIHSDELTRATAIYEKSRRGEAGTSTEGRPKSTNF